MPRYFLGETVVVDEQGELKAEAIRKLGDIIAEAVEVNADEVTIEFDKEGGLEVCFLCGSTGIGGVLVPAKLEEEVIGLIVDRAGMRDRPTGVLEWPLGDTKKSIFVEEYDTFGETAFRLLFKRPKPRSEKKKRR